MSKKIEKEDYDLDTRAYDAKVINDLNEWSSELFEFKKYVKKEAYRDWKNFLPLLEQSGDDDVQMFAMAMKRLQYDNLVRDIEKLQEDQGSYEDALGLEKQIKKVLLGGIETFSKLNNVLDNIEKAKKYKSTFVVEFMAKTLVPENEDDDVSIENIEFEENYEKNLEALQSKVEDQAQKIWKILKSSRYYIDSLSYEEEINKYISETINRNITERIERDKILRDMLTRAEKAVSRFRDRIYRGVEESDNQGPTYSLIGYYPDKMAYLASAYLKYQSKINNINAANKRKNPEWEDIPIESAFVFYRRIVRDIESEGLDVMEFNSRKLSHELNVKWKLKPQPESLYRASKGLDPDDNASAKYIVCLMHREKEKLEPMK